MCMGCPPEGDPPPVWFSVGGLVLALVIFAVFYFQQ